MTAQQKKLFFISRRPECQSQVSGFTGAKYKKFPTRQQAETFIRENGGSVSVSSTDSGSNSSADFQPIVPPAESVRVLVNNFFDRLTMFDYLKLIFRLIIMMKSMLLALGLKA